MLLGGFRIVDWGVETCCLHLRIWHERGLEDIFKQHNVAGAAEDGGRRSYAEDAGPEDGVQPAACVLTAEGGNQPHT